MADRQEQLATFLALTGADEATALTLLEAADWNLEQAVELHFHSVGADDPPVLHAGASAGPSSRPQPTYMSDEELARSLAAEGAGGLPQDDEVRAPLPTRTERLYGDSPGPGVGGYVPGMIDRAMRGMSQSRSHHINAFQDFGAAAEAAGGASSSAARAEEGLLAAAASSSAAAAAGAGGSAQTPGLSDLFKPPQDILFAGDFEMAKHKASKDGKWLLVNVQSPTEFASHQLNRDTWGNTLVKDLVKAQFVFWQTNYDTAEGVKVAAYYHLHNDYPAVLIIDSITGAKIWHRTGYIEAEKLLEELVPFMDHGPQDSGAALLAQTSLKRRHAQMQRGAAASTSAAAPAALSEEEELARAIAMSMQDQTGGKKKSEEDEEGSEDVEMYDDEDAMLEAAIAASTAEAAAPAAPAAPAVDPAAVAAKAREEASARLPAEPAEGPTSCRVAIRCPDGSRKQRRFNKADSVQALLDYCILEVEEAAAGRAFRLVPTYPGASPLTNPEENLQQAGAANAMLALQWAD